jgi:hypothetical protein
VLLGCITKVYAAAVWENLKKGGLGAAYQGGVPGLYTCTPVCCL